LQTPIGLTGNPLWKRTGQHGNVWLKAHLTLPIDSKIPNYRIAIEAIVGKGNKGDVAIDEIVFTLAILLITIVILKPTIVVIKMNYLKNFLE